MRRSRDKADFEAGPSKRLFIRWSGPLMRGAF
nr:MAG TPA: hypothetical protein [Inoviridae sp.]